MSSPDDSTRVFIFIVLLLFAGLGVVADVAALTATGGADGLGTFFPIIGAMVFFPFQLLAVGAVIAAIASRTKPVADAASKRTLFARIAAWMLGAPASVMLLCALASTAGRSELVFEIAEPGTMLWGPMWALGMVVAAIAFGRDNQAWPLLLTPLYPIAGALYMFS